jgi:hypothetical protein
MRDQTLTLASGKKIDVGSTMDPTSVSIAGLNRLFRISYGHVSSILFRKTKVIDVRAVNSRELMTIALRINQ